jgi:hypothetical protein
MLPIAVIWVWLCAYLNCAGWTLSACHGLNKAGYAIAFVVGLIPLLFWIKKSRTPLFPSGLGARFRWRFRHAFPFAFLALATMTFLGGALYLPANYDSLAYRTTRVLHWLAAGQWEWIHTDFPRLNTRTAGFEWVTAPLILFTGTDRFVFLINVISFLLLPGRVFALLTRLGVRPRAAWYWMWLFPSGYGYLLQAGSIVNDMFGACMALTAYEFALRASQEKKVSFLWTSMVAAALMTAVKAFNIVLLLPWAIAALPALTLLLRRPITTAAVLCVAAGASLLPTAYQNFQVCRDWTGLKIEQPTIGGNGAPYHLLANAINLPLDNIAPPIFPFAAQWEKFVAHIVPASFTAKMQVYMEAGLSKFVLPELQVEESAGLGLGVTFLLLVVLAKKIRAGDFRYLKLWSPGTLVPLGAWLSLGVFMVQVGASGPARYLLPFYVLLAAPILTGTVAGKFFEARFWRSAAMVVFAVAALLVVISPPRPLWPTRTVFKKLDAEHSSNHWVQRAWNVYSAYGSRADGFAPIIPQLPPDANPIGFIGFDEPETALWRPFGSRRVLNFCYNDSPADLTSRGIKYALVSERFFTQHENSTAADWVQRMNAKTVARFDLKFLAGQPPTQWLLVQIQ